MDSHLFSSYRMSLHGLERMTQRRVSASEVLLVLDNPTTIGPADSLGLVHFQAEVAGRQLRVTVNALTNVIVTVVTPGSAASKSPYGWFSIGADFEDGH